MNQHSIALIAACTMALAASALLALTASRPARAAEDEPPLALARDGVFYVGGRNTTVNGHTYVVGQMYVEMRIPAQQTHPYPIIMVHGGTRTGTTYTGTPDGRESWAQYFARRPDAAAPAIWPRPMGRKPSPTAKADSAVICSRRRRGCGRRRICTPSGRAAAPPTIRSPSR